MKLNIRALRKQEIETFVCFFPFLVQRTVYSSWGDYKWGYEGRGYQEHRRIARGGHGLPKVLLGRAMPYPSRPCSWPLLRWQYGCFSNGRLQDGWAASVFYPLAFKCIKIHLYKKKIVLDCIKILKNLKKMHGSLQPSKKML
jgi:hypothetical protein